MRSPFILTTLALSLIGPEAKAITFDRACERGESITLAAVGDVLLHGPLQKQAYASADTNGSLWRGITDLIQGADLAYANLEGPTALNVSRGGRAAAKNVGMRFDGSVYSGYPLFNYHPILAWDLKKAGFDVVSTANNHSMDRGTLGVDKTIEALNNANLPYTGTRTRAQAAAGNDFSWHVRTEVKGFNIAWLACTFSTNGMPDPLNQTIDCFQDEAQLIKEIRELAKDPAVDAVIVTPHWGQAEYTHRIEPSQKALGHRFLEAGALAIFGNHPHVTKPWEKYVTSDGRETFVVYSIGNFVSGQSSLAKKTSALVYLGLTKVPGEKAFINGAVYVPLYMLSAPWEVVAVDRNARAPREANTLLAKLFGADRRVDSRQRIETNFECR